MSGHRCVRQSFRSDPFLQRSLQFHGCLLTELRDAQVADLVAGTPPGFAVFAGSAATFYAALCVGAAGGILALSCVVPEACTQLFALAKAGRQDEARALQRRLMPLARLLGSIYGVPGLKAALHLIGYDVGVPRPPLAPVPDAALAALRDALAQFEEIPA